MAAGGPLSQLFKGMAAALASNRMALLCDAIAFAIAAGGVIWALDGVRGLGIELYDQQYFCIILGISIALAFLSRPVLPLKAPAALPLLDRAAAGLAFASACYIGWRYPQLVDLIFERPLDGVLASVLLLVLLIEALRRTTGYALTAIVVIFAAYALLAHLIPGSLAGRSSDWQKLSLYLAVDVNGVLGLPIQVAATIVVAFVLFGNVLNRCGGGAFFNDLALAAMGRFRGGGAKIAIVASTLFGSISGSAVANVVATGVVSIPLMKKTGYQPHRAAAIEAAASTGGQLMPPVMGAAAFLMAEFLQISYAEVALAAVIPGILYYTALFTQADLEAARDKIVPVKSDVQFKAIEVLRQGWYFILPFAVLLLALFSWNLKPERAVIWSIGALLTCHWLFGFRGQRAGVKALLGTLVETGYAMVDLILITGAAGIVIGVLAVSGLGFNLTLVLVQIGEGNLYLLLFLSAVVCIVLGMGLPTVGVYVLLATLVAPSLIEVGISPIAAHLYVMYFGMMSMITPPVAIAAYAAASLAGAAPMRTGLAATAFGWSAFVVPLLFVFTPSLLLDGAIHAIAIAFVLAVLGVWLISATLIGYGAGPLGAAGRGLYLIAGVATLVPASIFTYGAVISVLGALMGVGLIVRGMTRPKPAQERLELGDVATAKEAAGSAQAKQL